MKENENYDYTFWDKLLSKLNWGLWLFIALIALVFGIAGHVNAASSQTYFPFIRNQNGTIPEHFINKIDSTYGETYYYLIGNYHSRGNPYDDGEWVPLLLVPKSNGVPLGAVQANEYTFTVSSATISNNTGVVYGTYWRNNRSNNAYNFGSYSGNNTYFANQQSPVYSNTKDFYGNFNLYDINTGKAIMLDIPPIIIPEGGHPSVFDDTGLNLDNSLNATTVPTAPSSYSVTFPTAPTWDSSSPVQSVFDYLIWGFSCLNVLLQGVINKLSEWIGFVGSLLGYLVQKILDYIKAVVQWLYNQFLSWLTPYLKILSLISKFLFDEELQISVLDVLNAILDSIDNLFAGTFFEDIWDWFNDNYVTPSLTNLYNIVDAIDKIRVLFTADSQPLYLRGAFFDSYMGQFITQGRRLGVGLLEIFQNIQTPDSLIFAVDFGELPIGHYFRDVGIIYIDFSWYAGIRTLIQTLFVTCLYVGVGFTLFFKIPNIINGSQGLDSMFGVTYTTTPYEGNDNVYFGQRRIGGPVVKGGKH